MASAPGRHRSLADWLAHIGSVHPVGMDLGLDRVRAVAQRLDVLPPAPRCILVAGTNGKGSTCVAMEHLLLGMGHRVGTTLSPHVHRFNERIRIDGQEVGDASICRALETVEQARGELTLTYFEFAALAALLLFRQAEVDCAVLEVGLGGRLDAFNIVSADLAVITSIGLDHQDYLGDDLESIGREKAGIFRPRQRVVLGTVTHSVHEAAARFDCPTLVLGQHILVEEGTQSWTYACPALGLQFRSLVSGGLAAANCALAITAAAWLFAGEDVPVSVLETVGLPGRMESLVRAGRLHVLDVAHNPAAASFLDAQLQRRYGDRRFVAVLGMLADKDAAGVASALADRVRAWVLVPTYGLRGRSALDLGAAMGREHRQAATFEAGLEIAESLSQPGDGILIVGSFSTVEQARTHLQPRAAGQDPR